MLKEAKDRLKNEFLTATENKALKKAVFSRPKSKSDGKCTLSPFVKNGEVVFKLEAVMPDGKVRQKNLDTASAFAFVYEAPEKFKQINLVGENASVELIVSDKGKTRFTGSLVGAKTATLAEGQDRKKSYMITPEEDGELLYLLGITDKNGRIKDKKQAKYRQINKFIEQIEAVSDALPKNELCICDICCGKSYLTFAVYRYFTRKGVKVKMYGVDLKKDVIELCRQTADKLGYTGMRFECGDAFSFVPPQKPDLVISLHACDVATDFAIAGAVENGARVILSTPCCQHELNSQLHCSELSFITEHSVLKQKLATAATDALRALVLEIYGYKVTVCELIDPEETPKNVIIRAVKTARNGTRGQNIAKYKAACELLGVKPKLSELLPLPDITDTSPLIII